MMRFLRANPFVALLLPLIVIICICNYLPNNPLCHADKVDYLYVKDTLIQVWVTHIPEEKNKSVQVQAEVCPNNGVVYLYIDKDSNSLAINQGDILKVKTTIQRGDTLGSFDYGAYLWKEGISGVGFVRTNKWKIIDHKTLMTPRAIAERLRNSVLQSYKKSEIGSRELGVISALTVGYKSLLDTNTKEQFAAAGAMHVLAVSGLHVGIIYGILLLVLGGSGPFKPLLKQRKRRIINGCIIVFALWFFACMTGLSPSVVRASLMFSLFEIGRLSRRPVSTYNIIAASAWFCLVFQPMSLFSVSFQLSYSAVVSIVYFGKRLEIIKFRRPIYQKTIGYIIGLVVCSIAAQIGTLPITLYYFGRLSNVFILTNLVVIPMAGIIIYTAIFYLLFSPIPFLGKAIAFVLNGATKLMNDWIALLESLPHSFVDLHINFWQVILLYATVIFSAVAFRKQNYWYFLGVVISLLSFVSFWF